MNGKIHECIEKAGWQGIRAAFQAASAGDTVRIAPGIYRADSTLTVPSGIRVVGIDSEAGTGNAEDLANLSDIPTIWVESGTPALSVKSNEVILEGLRFIARSNCDVLIDVCDSIKTRFLACHFDGGGRTSIALSVTNADEGQIKDCLIECCSDDPVWDHACVFIRQSAIEMLRNRIRGGPYGVVVQGTKRDANGKPKNSLLRGNKCSESIREPIAVYSSFARLEENECWGSRVGGGIVVTRAPETPSEPSHVDVVANQCHHNEQFGIGILSSKGKVENNTCYGSRSGGGIAVQRDRMSPKEPSQVDVVSNQCFDNKYSGIDFFSSHGLVQNNKCWGSQNGCGIQVRRNSTSKTEPSQVDVVSNRCYDNKGGGINFYSSIGRVEYNECWGIRQDYGISISRDPEFPVDPCRVEVISNQCHDNEEGGILFASSHGLAASNECWGNRHGIGILITRNYGTLSEPSTVEVVSNRCYNNYKSGIVFSISFGRAKDNECWGSLTECGIGVEPDPKYPTEFGQVDVIGNRCHSNKLTGIAYFSSKGRVLDNECWSNLHSDDVYCEGTPTPEIVSHRTERRISAEDLTRLHRSNSRLRTWLLEQPLGDPKPDTLAKALLSGGCPHCLERFLDMSGDTKPEPSREQATEPISPASSRGQERIPCYRVHLEEREKDKRSIPIRRVPASELVSWQSYSEGKATDWLSALLKNFGKDLHKAAQSPMKTGMVWWVAFVSAQDPELNLWCRDMAGRDKDLHPVRTKKTAPPPRSRIVVLDFAGDGAFSPKQDDWVKAQLRRNMAGQNRFSRWCDAFFCSPFRSFVVSVAIGIAFGILIQIFFLPDIEFSSQPWENFWTLSFDYLLMQGMVVAQHLKNHWVVSTLCGLFLGVVIFNRQLPSHFFLSIAKIATISDWLPAFTGMDKLMRWLEKSPSKPAGWLRRLLKSRTCDRFWVRRKVFGYRLFERFRRSPPPPTLLVIRNADVPRKAQVESLHYLLELRPRNHSLFIVTQMPGISMLASGFLEPWFGDKSAAPPPGSKTYVLHDPTSVHLHSASGVDSDKPVLQAKVNTSTLEDLGSLLGWESEKTGTGPDERWYTWANDIVRSVPELHQLPAAIVLGSTPTAPMRLYERKNSTTLRNNWKKRLSPIASLLGFDKGKCTDLASGRAFRELDKNAKRADALMLVASDPNQVAIEWVGRVGYRVLLAELLLAWERGGHNKGGNLGNANRSIRILSRGLAAAEWYHLRQARQNIKSAGLRDRVHLHLEAALFLAEDSYHLGAKPHPQVVKAWEDAYEALLSHRDPGGSDSLNSFRIWMPFLKISKRYEASRIAFSKLPTIESVLKRVADPFSPSNGNPAMPEDFGPVAEIRDFMLLLGRRRPATAQKLLRSKLKQSWAALPKSMAKGVESIANQLDKMALRYLLQSDNSKSLFDRASSLAERSTLVIQALIILCRARIGGESDTEVELARIADAISRLERMASEDGISTLEYLEKPIHEFWVPISAEAAEAARALVNDSRMLAKLGDRLKAGSKTAHQLGELSAEIRCELEGVDLGVFGDLHEVLVHAQDIDEVRLLSA